MPSKFVLRNFTGNSYYHIFNRGIENKAMFLDMQDFRVFLFYLYIYLTPPNDVKKKYPDLPARLLTKNLSKDIKPIAYCLMPNHFHLVLYQPDVGAIPSLMRQIMNGYTLYFNNKYKRLGSLVAGRYKSVKIMDENVVTNLIRYIHMNPVMVGMCTTPEDYEWSSYRNYIGTDGQMETDKERILSKFGTLEEFKNFTTENGGHIRDEDRIRHLVIEEEFKI